MPKLKCTVLDDYQNVVLTIADWSPVADDIEIDIVTEHIADEDALAAFLADSDILCVIRERTPLTASLLARLPKLKLIATAGGPNRSIDMAACAAHGVTVCSTAGAVEAVPGGFNATAELAFGLMLALARNIAAEDANIRAGGWMTTVGHGLYGKTLGIIGLGRLGGTLAGYGKAFGMEVIAWSSSLTEERCREVGALLVTKEALFERSDFVSIHYVLSERSRGLVGASDLARMKTTAYLINTSRGPIVDEDALVAALRERRIAGAGLDVFWTEPLPADHPLRSLPNTVLTPHLGYVVEKTYEGFFTGFVRVIRAWFDGRPISVLER